MLSVLPNIFVRVGSVNLLSTAQETAALKPRDLVDIIQFVSDRGQNVNLGMPSPFIAFSAISSLLHIRQMVLYQHLIRLLLC